MSAEGTIQIVKLTSGEELIGKVGEVEVGGSVLVQIEKPAVVMLIPDQKEEGKFGVGLAPYAPYADGDFIPIFPNHIISILQRLYWMNTTNIMVLKS